MQNNEGQAPIKLKLLANRENLKAELMAKTKNVKKKDHPIITGFLEKVNASIFDKYLGEITDMTNGHQGLYALYRKSHLYYVGLARNLRNRIKHHLKDRHQGKWTHFSLYIIRKEDHIKELESLLLRIAYPKGNSVRGKLKSTNLLPLLKVQVKRKIKEELEALFKGSHAYSANPKTAARKIIKTAEAKKNAKRLSGAFRAGKCIYATYKGKDHKAWVFNSGTIKYSGQLYNSPTAAAKVITGGTAINGWSFWKYKDKSGTLVKLSTVRK